ncbi:MAG: glycosyltransferase family 39 protein [Candidatus Acidiferrales bacterium]
MSIVRRAFLSLSVIIVFAFAVRAGLYWYIQLHARVPIIYPAPFGYETGSIAKSIATGNGFSSPLRIPTGPTAWLTPIYPYLLAGVFKLFGVYSYLSNLVIILLNDLFSALTCIPIYFIAKRLGGAKLAAGAAWVWALYPNAILLPFEWVWDTSLSAMMAGFVLWATMAVADSRRLRDWIAYGLLYGAALMTNASFASVLPFLFGWLAWKLFKAHARWVQLPAVAVLAAMMSCVPWTIRNYVTFHKFIPLRSNLGLELWLGNNEQVPDTWAGFLHPNDYPPEGEKYARMGEAAYMAEKQHEAVQFMLGHPRDTMRFFWRRFADNWLGTWEPIQDIWPSLSWESKTTLLSNISFSLLGLVGALLLLRQKSPYAFPMAMFPLIFPIVYYITHSSLRYRHPIDPVMAVLTAVALGYPLRAIFGKKRMPATNESLHASEARS